MNAMKVLVMLKALPSLQAQMNYLSYNYNRIYGTWKVGYMEGLLPTKWFRGD